MCGILGIVCKDQLDPGITINRMNDALDAISHRGPDDSGLYLNKNIALGHARLSIIDLSEAGKQPMISKDNQSAITYNGEVYNFKDLKKTLQNSHINFSSKTDTEVVFELYKFQGVSSFKLLNGMFAFCVIDRKRSKAFLVRDRFGIKPLYYQVSSEQILFSSEIKGIKTLAGNLSTNTVNLNALPEWSYYGSSLGRKTIHKDINQLLPGHYIEIDLDTLKFEEKPYWLAENIEAFKKNSPNNIDSIVMHTTNLLENAVSRQLVGDVPVGVFLSGGIDSSAITAFASRHYDKPINTFAAGFDFSIGESELPKASIVAKQFGTNHHEVHISGYDIADIIKKMVDHHDAPFADAANIPLFLLGQEVQRSVKVVLQGDGGDEFFAGYKRYLTLSNSFLWQPFKNISNKLHKNCFIKNKNFFIRQRYLDALNQDDDGLLMALLLTVESQNNSPIRIFSQQVQKKIEKIDPFDSYKDCNVRFSKENLVQKMLYTDTQLILPNIFLEKVDKSTMAASIEVRVPFLDNELSEFVMSLPSNLKVRQGQKKWLLKKALHNILPHEILYGKKTGFSVPYQLWLKGPLYELFFDQISLLKSNKCNILDFDYIEKLMQQNIENKRDHSFILWKTLNLMIWLSARDFNLDT